MRCWGVPLVTARLYRTLLLCCVCWWYSVAVKNVPRFIALPSFNAYCLCGGGTLLNPRWVVVLVGPVTCWYNTVEPLTRDTLNVGHQLYIERGLLHSYLRNKSTVPTVPNCPRKCLNTVRCLNVSRHPHCSAPLSLILSLSFPKLSWLSGY